MAIPGKGFVLELYRAVSAGRLDTGRYKSTRRPLRSDIATLQLQGIMAIVQRRTNQPPEDRP
jgi:hypothetical protein